MLAAFPPGEFRTVAEAAAAAGVGEREVVESVDRLAGAGYSWERHPGRGIALVARSDLLHHAEVVPLLRTRRLGRPVLFFRSVGSTNDMLLEGAFERYGEGTVLATEEQTAGRGRRGRSWQAPPFRALQFSVLLRPDGGAETAALSTLTSGLAVAEALRETTGMEAKIRWPNDLAWDGRKVCGILSEYSGARGALVIGIGLNVNQRLSELPEGAASVQGATGVERRRGEILAAILGRLEHWMERLAREGFEPVRAEAERLSSLLGRRVTISLGERELTGLATGIGPGGGLVIRAEGGEKEYRAGEVVRVVAWEGGAP